MLKRILVAAAVVALTAGAAFAQQAKTIKYTHFQPGKLDQPKHAAAIAFKSYVESNTNGSLKVELYPAGQLGNANQVMEGLRLGSIEMGVVHDGGIPSAFKPFQIFGIPYLFTDQAMAWEVLDGPFGQEFAEAMRKQTGVRLLGYADNGIRNFTNSKRPIKAPEDMKGMKIRVQPSPVFLRLVESLGASPSAIDWAELPAALAQGTVEGQENGVTNILAASLYQHQKHITLGGHVYSLHAYLISDRFFSRLTPQEQLVVTRGADIAKWIHRGMTSAQDTNAEPILKQHGMEVTTLTPQQVDAFRKLAQPPVREYVEKEVGKEWVAKLFAAIDQYNQQGKK
jgi:TRAP-type transport system periplasmic protein